MSRALPKSPTGGASALPATPTWGRNNTIRRHQAQISHTFIGRLAFFFHRSYNNSWCARAAERYTKSHGRSKSSSASLTPWRPGRGDGCVSKGSTRGPCNSRTAPQPGSAQISHAAQLRSLALGYVQLLRHHARPFTTTRPGRANLPLILCHHKCMHGCNCRRGTCCS